ncbi:MAG: P-II family nitrogen regulator [Planctomycetaceae bacterium]
MRRLVAIVKPFKAEAVARALLDAGAVCLHFQEARGYGRQKGHLELYRDDPDRVAFLPKVRLECALPEEAVETAIAAVTEAARTGRIGDGKLFLEALA